VLCSRILCGSYHLHPLFTTGALFTTIPVFLASVA
jgi:hypothetical protein